MTPLERRFSLWPWAACAGLAMGLPLLLAWSAVPDSVLYNQLVALGGWGLWLAIRHPSATMPRGRASLWAVTVALCAIAVYAVASQGLGQGGSVLVVAAALAILWAGAGSSTVEQEAAAWALSLAGLLSVVVALLQYGAPGWVDGILVAANTSPGRAIGNMRQPNHLATALLCAMVWTTWLWQARRWPPRVGVAAINAIVVAVALSASRTGALSLGVLVLWAWVDRSLPRAARWSLALTPLVYGLAWAALAAWAALDHGNFYAADRLHSNGDPSSSRFAIWRNALELLAQQPWTGVGWGNFNFAWTFTPFPDRPVAFFDHTHNLPLQFAVEIGMPATLLVLGLLGWALWRARGAWQYAAGERGRSARAALVMLAALAVHSLLEYPLWYAYFLLPGAWAVGVFLGSAPAADVVLRPASRRSPLGLRVAGVLMLVGASYAAWDHRRIEAIFAPAAGAAPLAERIAEGRKSLLFGHHADYAAVTSEPRDQRLESFQRPLHQLVDVRLLIAYIEALRANGRTAEALYAAQRLREFRRDDAQAYFKECDAEATVSPWQCEQRPVPLDWRDLEP